VTEEKLANGDTGACIDIGIDAVLNNPSSLLQKAVDCLSS
jgi:hypothetical protein